MKVIDERSKAYSYAGDDRVNQAITGKVTQYHRIKNTVIETKVTDHRKIVSEILS
jgi:hypothetical protein